MKTKEQILYRIEEIYKQMYKLNRVDLRFKRERLSPSEQIWLKELELEVKILNWVLEK